VETLGILVLGALAFCIGTAAGVLMGKIMYRVTGGKVNPLIGAAGVSAVPMAARVVNKVGLEANHHNFLLMHAMGPNVAGVIGSAVAAGVLLALTGTDQAPRIPQAEPLERQRKAAGSRIRTPNPRRSPRCVGIGMK
jgi:hypothetical protein